MKVSDLELSGLKLFEPEVFADSRGHLMEMFHVGRYREAGLNVSFVQDNWSRSKQGTLRGLHFQNPRPQGKLVMVTRGAVYDVVVDIRKSSPTFGKSVGLELSESNCKQLWIPPGFAHGFLALRDDTDFLYKCTDVYVPGTEASILWNDPDLNIEWPMAAPLLSKKDEAAPRLRDCSKVFE